MATSRSPRSLLAVTGLKREATLLAGPGLVTVTGGGDGPALLAQLDSLITARYLHAVVSIGLGGALSPDLAVGDWVVGERIVGGTQTWESDPSLVAQLRTGLAGSARPKTLQDQSRPNAEGEAGPFGPVHTGAIAGSDVIEVDAAAKAALRVTTRALAVDMESHVAAAFAAAHGLPFAALRVISDDADRALPKAAQAGMKKDGGIDILAVLRELAKDPRQLPALIRTGREAEVAFGRLRLLGRNNLLGRLGIGDPDLRLLTLDVI